MKTNKRFAAGMAVLMLTFIVVACSGKKEGGGSASSAAQKVNFGNYPADYSIAYIATYGSMFGLPKTLTVETLFGPNAYFATTFNGDPVVVTLESTKGTKESFTAQLLLTAKASEKNGNKDVKVSRMQVTFESDSMSEKSYLRYVKLINLESGKINEQSSYGDERSDAGILAFFAGLWSQGLFWDISKYQQ